MSEVKDPVQLSKTESDSLEPDQNPQTEHANTSGQTPATKPSKYRANKDDVAHDLSCC